jgi:hypothetical protein
MTFLTPDQGTSRYFKYFWPVPDTGDPPFEARKPALAPTVEPLSFFLKSSKPQQPNVVFRFREILAYLQPRLNIFLNCLDELGIRRDPIRIVAFLPAKIP